MTAFETFYHLHHREQPLLIGNVWGLTSARIFEQKGFSAIATSSKAVALSHGYEDGEQLPFDLLLATVRRISRHIHIPLSVDMEGGYSRNNNGIIRNIDKLLDLGVVGINLEDSVIGKNSLQPVADFQRTLSAIAEHLEKKGSRLFINARTDAYLLRHPLALQETVQRAQAYETAGASGIFAPFLFDAHAISELVAATSLPVNVFCGKQLPGFNELAKLGVKRISMGNAMYAHMTQRLEQTIDAIVEAQNFEPLF